MYADTNMESSRNLLMEVISVCREYKDSIRQLLSDKITNLVLRVTKF